MSGRLQSIGAGAPHPVAGQDQARRTATVRTVPSIDAQPLQDGGISLPVHVPRRRVPRTQGAGVQKPQSSPCHPAEPGEPDLHLHDPDRVPGSRGGVEVGIWLGLLCAARRRASLPPLAVPAKLVRQRTDLVLDGGVSPRSQTVALPRMTTGLFTALVALVVAGAVGAFLLSTRPAVTRLVARTGTMPPPMIGAVSILFGLFVGFSSAEITQRNGSLRLATQREVGAARSILSFTTGIGPQAYSVREGLIEYLRVVATTERDWLRSGARGEPPGAGPIYSLNLVTTGFVQQPGVSDVLKGALLTRVDDLTNARTERLTLSRGAGSIPQWVGLAALAMMTQMVGAMAVAGQRGGGAIFLAGYTLTAVVGLLYLGWADGLVGPGRSREQSASFAMLLAQAPRLTAPGEDTLSRMRGTGKVVIGARTDQFPFAYVDGAGEQVGYAIDLCRSIVEHVRTDAGLGPVQVDMLALSPANRVAMIVNSTADMECDLTTETSVRESQVDFLDSPVFFGHAEIVVRAASPIADVQGLRGRRLIAVAGSSNLPAAADLDATHHLGLTIVPARDMPEAFRMLASGEGTR